MKHILIAALTAAAAFTPAAHAKKSYIVQVSVTADDIVVTRGDLVISASGARTYARELIHYVPPEILRAFMTTGEIRPNNQSLSVASSASGAVTSSAGGASVASEIAVGRNRALEAPATPPFANDTGEVAYDFEANRRLEIDHANKTIKTAETVHSPANPGRSILQGAPPTADPGQVAALGGLLRTFTQPRLDPKREIRTEPTGQTVTVPVNDQFVPCELHTLHRMGGEIGEACLADPNAVPYGDELMTHIRQLPLPGAGGDDLVGKLRQLTETGKLPIRFNYSEYELPVTFGSIVEVDDEQPPAEITDGGDLDDDTGRLLDVTEQKILAALADYERRAQ